MANSVFSSSLNVVKLLDSSSTFFSITISRGIPEAIILNNDWIELKFTVTVKFAIAYRFVLQNIFSLLVWKILDFKMKSFAEMNYFHPLIQFRYVALFPF